MSDSNDILVLGLSVCLVAWSLNRYELTDWSLVYLMSVLQVRGLSPKRFSDFD